MWNEVFFFLIAEHTTLHYYSVIYCNYYNLNNYKINIMLNIENYEKLNILVIYIISKLCECGIVFYLFVYIYIKSNYF